MRFVPGLPPHPFSTAVWIRVAAVWTFIRLAAAGVEVDAGVSFTESLTGPSLGAVWTIAFVLIALRVELGRRRELVFLANLSLIHI